MAGTLAEKVWENHIVRRGTDGAPATRVTIEGVETQ